MIEDYHEKILHTIIMSQIVVVMMMTMICVVVLDIVMIQSYPGFDGNDLE